MNKTSILRAATLASVTLLSLSLAPSAHAGYDHDRADDSGKISHRVNRDQDFRSSRHQHQQRPLSRDHEHHHDYEYREQRRQNHPHPVVWQRSYDQPRLVIRLPWLIFVNY